MVVAEKKLIVWNPYTKGYFDNPYEHLLECQANSPIQKSIHNQFVLFKHKNIKEALKLPTFNTSNLSQYFANKEPVIFKNNVGCPYMSMVSKKWLMYLDDEEHITARNFCEEGLNSFNYETLVDEAAEEVLNNFSTKKEFDLVDLSAQLPSIVISKLLGIYDTNSFAKYKQIAHSLALSQDIFIPIKTYLEINKDMEWIYRLLSEVYDKKKIINDNSLTSYLLELNKKNNNLFTKSEIISILIVLFLGAIETSKDSISMICFELMKNRNLLDILKTGSSVDINLLVEECLRYTSTLQYTIRVNKEPYELESFVIPPNSQLLLCLAAGNRDSEVFETPNTIIPDRRNNPHFAFGAGKHSCIGAKLARLELRSFLPKFAPLLEKLDFNSAQPPVWQKTVFMRGVEKFPVIYQQ